MVFARYPTVADEVVRYLEDGTLNEALGVGPTLSLRTSHTERWTDLLPGVQGAAFDEVSGFVTSAYYAGLDCADEVTVECIVRLFELSGVSDFWTFVQYGYTGESLVTNIQYSLGAWDVSVAGSSLSQRKSVPAFWHEHGAGGTEATCPARDHVLDPAGIYHVAARRHAASGGNAVVDLWVNRQQVASETLVAHGSTGSTNRRLYIGANLNGTTGDAASDVSGAIGLVRICARALTDEELLASYDATLGGVFGTRKVAP